MENVPPLKITYQHMKYHHSLIVVKDGTKNILDAELLNQMCADGISI